MSWVLKRWLGSSGDETSPSPSQTLESSQTPPHIQEQQQQQQLQQQNTLQSQQQQQQQPPRRTLPNSQKILLGGLFFLAFSTSVTRRALARRRLQAIPPFYSSSVYYQPPGNGALDAIEAFNIATINVAAVAMTALGAGMCAFGINNVEQARVRLRTGMGISEGIPPTPEEEKQFEQDLEEWVGKMLDKKDLGEVKKKLEAARLEAEKQKKSS